jgi:hypothetical protein
MRGLMKIRLTMGQKRAKNPFAVCRALAKKKGWTEAKFKRCAKAVKMQLRGK